MSAAGTAGRDDRFQAVPLVDGSKLTDIARIIPVAEFRALLALFEPNACNLMAELGVAAESGNHAPVAAALHGLRGMAANLGLLRVAEMARDLEQLGTLDGADALARAVADTIAELNRWQDAGGDPG